MRKLLSALTALSLLIAFSSCAASIDEIDTNSSSNTSIESNIEEETEEPTEEEIVVLDAFEGITPDYQYKPYPNYLDLTLSTYDSPYRDRMTYSDVVKSADSEKIVIEVTADIKNFEYDPEIDPANYEFETDTKTYELNVDEILSYVINKEQFDKYYNDIIENAYSSYRYYCNHDAPKEMGDSLVACYALLPKENTVFYENVILNSTSSEDYTSPENNKMIPNPSIFFIFKDSDIGHCIITGIPTISSNGEHIGNNSLPYYDDYTFYVVDYNDNIQISEETARKAIEDKIDKLSANYDFDVIEVAVE